MSDYFPTARRTPHIPDAETQRAVRSFMTRVEGRYPATRALLYGSRARGTHGADSDADIAVILGGETGSRWEIMRDISGLASDVMMDTGISIQAIPFWESEIEQPESSCHLSLVRAVKRDGLELWPES